MLSSNPNTPTLVHDNYHFQWQMTRCERFAFISLIEEIRPEVAIEVGTAWGGSLQVLSRHAKKVYSIDICDESRKLLEGKFDNVEFLVGDSAELLPELLRKISENGEKLGVVLLDGNHTTIGIKTDIDNMMDYKPIRPLYIICHDSFYPPCRAGMLSANWDKSPYVDFVEIDFIPGVYHYESFDTAPPRSMYGGLAVARMLPEKRTEKAEKAESGPEIDGLNSGPDSGLKIHQSQKGLFDTVLPHWMKQNSLDNLHEEDQFDYVNNVWYNSKKEKTL